MSVYKILFFGPAGVGKDTQADLLVECLGVVKLSMGQIFRDKVASGSVLGKQIAPYLQRGEIVPAGVGPKLMRVRILQPDVQQSGYVVSSFPRTLESFKEYLSFDLPTHLIVLEASDEVVRQRMLKRGRHDDQEQAINTRLNLYREIDEQTIDWVSKHTDILVIRIDASQSLKEVWLDVLNAVVPMTT